MESDYTLSHFWFATVHEVLHADWHDVWHSPQPPLLADCFSVALFKVFMLFMVYVPFYLFFFLLLEFIPITPPIPPQITPSESAVTVLIPSEKSCVTRLPIT